MIVWLFTLTAIATALGMSQRTSSQQQLQQRLQRLPVHVRNNRQR